MSTAFSSFRRYFKRRSLIEVIFILFYGVVDLPKVKRDHGTWGLSPLYAETIRSHLRGTFTFSCLSETCSPVLKMDFFYCLLKLLPPFCGTLHFLSDPFLRRTRWSFREVPGLGWGSTRTPVHVSHCTIDCTHERGTRCTYLSKLGMLVVSFPSTILTGVKSLVL